LAAVDALRQSVARARTMAGWGDAEPDLIEFSAQFGYQLLQFAEPLGAAGLESPRVNPSGGRMAGNPLVVAGLSRVAECVTQLRGDAGERQVLGAHRALAHGMWGIGAQAHAVAVLEGGS
ncbi:MAG: thiolase C-terminal domain-containing protein, partial [Nostocoides sp.]